MSNALPAILPPNPIYIPVKAATPANVILDNCSIRTLFLVKLFTFETTSFSGLFSYNWFTNNSALCVFITKKGSYICTSLSCIANTTWFVSILVSSKFYLHLSGVLAGWWMNIHFIQSFHWDLLSTWYAPVTILEAEEAMNKIRFSLNCVPVRKDRW